MTKPIYIIGDIHSNIQALKNLFSHTMIEANGRLIFLGDYIDKGTHTQETVDYLLHLSNHYDTTFLRGNHDYVWDRYLNHGELFRSEFLLNYGGTEALMQFEPNAAELIENNRIGNIRRYLRKYLSLIADCSDYALLDDYLAIHGGVTSEQMDESPLRLKEANYFLRLGEMDLDALYIGHYRIVAGHSVLGDTPHVHPGYINIDLGAGYGKFLGAFDVTRQRVIRSDGLIFKIES